MFDWINEQIVSSAARNVAQWGAGILVTDGVITSSQQTTIVGLVVGAAGLAWSFYAAAKAHTAHQVVKAVTASTPDTKTAVVTAAKSTTGINADTVLKSVFNR